MNAVEPAEIITCPSTCVGWCNGKLAYTEGFKFSVPIKMLLFFLVLYSPMYPISCWIGEKGATSAWLMSGD